jgi:hypothetical protein
VKVLTMSPVNAGLVLEGKKCSTIRPQTYAKRFVEGEVMRLGKTDRSVRIDKIETIEFEGLGDEVLRSEGGFRSKSDLLSTLRRFYPSLTGESRVVLINFTLV